MATPLPSYDLDEPSLSDREPSPPIHDSRPPARRPRERPPRPPRHRLARLATFLPLLAPRLALWIGLGGGEGISGEWPPLFADHGIHFHHGLVTRHFLRTSGITAGYDPSFMSGYAMSIVSDLSSTFSNLFMLAFPDRPAMSYKLHVLACAGALPWLVALAAISWRARPVGVAVAVGLFLIYFWTDFPVNYAALGMLNYLLSIPLGLLAVSGLTAYLGRGGFARWLGAALACSAVFLVHVTSPMLVGPAGLLAYAVAFVRSRREGQPFPWSRHLGLWAIAPIVLAANAFWWVPGFLLRSTKASGDIAFLAHPESVLGRILEIFWKESPAEAVALGLGILGVAVLARREPVAAAGLGGFLVAGFGWGYLAGFSRTLDALQPGRHTYACYSASCLAAGFGLAEILDRLRSSSVGRLDRWAFAGLVLIGSRFFAYPVLVSLGQRLDFNAAGLPISFPPDLAAIRSKFGPEPFLSSRPSPRALWLVEQVRKHVKPGERLLYEETGLAVPGLGDPFAGRHLSPILPWMTGVEVIGGPYLHATVTTNFTQFGEGKLFGEAGWNRDRFERYARLYRPSALACWSPGARAFCRSNPDLIQVVEDDGTLLVARVLGFGGEAIRGKARVEAGPNRLVVRDLEAGPDGLVVLRYHLVPHLRATPPATLEPVFLEEDPVPFIGLRPSAGPVAIEMDFTGRTIPIP